MKAFLMDPFARQITEVETDGELQDIYRLTGCDCICTLNLNAFGVRDVIFLDDEGRFKPADKRRYWNIGRYPYPVTGKGLVLGVTPSGKSCAPRIDISVLQEHIEFIGALAVDPITGP